MEISVILCTYDRCRLLTDALESIAACTVPPSVEWEVLVIDNNSRDQTRAVVQDFSRRYPGRFRYVFEAQAGKSNALNTGVREAQGKVLAFVDDDVSVEPGWLHSLTAAMMDGPWAGTGGRTLAAHPFPLPDWLSREHPIQWGGVLGGLLDLGDQPLELRMAPYGANMAFRKEMFVRYGGFRTDLGPRPGNLIRCEDTEFGHRLLNAGERLRYEPLAIVYHPIQENRLQKEYFLTWWFDYGRAQAREQGQRPLVRGTLRQYVEITAGMGARLGIRTLRWMRTLNPHQKFFYKCRVWMTIGQILEICGR